MAREYYELPYLQIEQLLATKLNSYEIDQGTDILEVVPILGVMVGYAF